MFLGVHSIKQEEKETRQVRKVKGRVPHPCYDAEFKVNDIMLLKVSHYRGVSHYSNLETFEGELTRPSSSSIQLDKKVKLTKAVRPLALPVPVPDVQAGTPCSVSGWGATENNAKTMSDVLKSTNVTVIDRRKCNSADYYNMTPIITYSMLCAGSVDKTRVDSCQVCVCVRGGWWEELQEDGLIVMTGMELLERCQTHQTHHGNHMFDPIPSMPFQTLP